jgi:glycerate-2-kinase
MSEELTAYARKLALTLVLEGLRAVDPKSLLKSRARVVESKLIVDDHEVNVGNGVYVVAIGKAAGKMAEAAEEILGSRIRAGVATVPRGAPSPRLARITPVAAGHPHPDEGSLEAGKLALRVAEEARRSGCPLLALISGGGSALAEVPVPGVTLEDLRSVNDLLLRSGASITEINTVRKHLSLLKGGRLAAAAYPSPVLALVLSDVVGDKLEVIASGPTVPDPSTYEEALDILKRYNLTASAPRTVLEVLEKGARGELPETPKPGDETLSKAHALLLGSNLTALKAMDAYAKKLGLNSVVLTSMLQGEAREAAKALAAIALEVKRSSIPVAPPAAVICGGETTVKVRGRGRGGRNQEFALSAALQIEGEGGIAIAAIGSDGIDGPTDAAGAIVDGFTVKKAKRLGLDPRKFLEENNSYEFFNIVGGHIKTGPTGTNVNDFYLAVVIAQEWE